ncbi:kinase-like protein, partial [Fistulina hepatica ATCC 64428]
LIKGLAYLHKLCIAHRDIKPDNLLIDGDFCLKIIDFDIAIQVKDKDEEVSGHRGAKGWEAPEVKNKLSTYSPIKADRWSCGHVI